jgi:hypothetical protein
MATSVAFLAVAGLRTAALRDGGQRRFHAITATAAVDPTDGDVARATITRPLSPAARLRGAVLIQALMDLRRFPPTTRRYVEARRWLEDDDERWPLAFVPCCDVLGLEPTALRARALARPAPGHAGRPWLHAAGR